MFSFPENSHVIVCVFLLQNVFESYTRLCQCVSSQSTRQVSHFLKFVMHSFLARLLILIKKGGLLQLKFGVGVGVNIYLWAR